MEDNKRIDNLYKNVEHKWEDFKPMSDYITEKHVSSVPGKELTKEARNTISEISAVDMAIGAESKKFEYILMGSAIGIVGTIVILQIKKIFKKNEA